MEPFNWVDIDGIRYSWGKYKITMAPPKTLKAKYNLDI